MNFKVDKQNVIPFPTMDFKPPKMELESVLNVSQVPSFSELLSRGTVDKKDDHFKETKSQEIISEKPAETKDSAFTSTAPQSTENTSNEDEESEDELGAEENLDRDALEYSIRLVDFMPKSLVPGAANEWDAKSRENGNLPAKQKTKELPSTNAKKEDNAIFLEETKKLTESFLKKINAENQERGFSQKQDMTPKEGNVVRFPKFEGETFGLKKESKVEMNHRFTETQKKGSVPGDVISGKGKEVVVEKKESHPPLSEPKIKEKTKTKKGSDHSSQEEKQTTTELVQKSIEKFDERNVRSLGLKDKEFLKSESSKQTNAEKIKTENTGTPIKMETSGFSSKEEGNSSEGKSFRNQNMNVWESKLSAKLTEFSETEKLSKPKETNLKQNIDELVKQAKFDIVQNGKSTAEIVMNPKEYGRLTLKVTVDGEKVEGRILVESEEMQKSLLNEIQTIKENLKESGLELESLIIDLWDNGNRSFGDEGKKELNQAILEQAKYRYSGISGSEEDTESNFSYIDNEVKSLEFFA